MNYILTICAALLAWDNPNPVGTVGKYVVYHGRTTSGPFTNLVETTSTNTVLPALRSGLHVFYVTAVGTNGFESDPSNQVLSPVVAPPVGTKITIIIP